MKGSDLREQPEEAEVALVPDEIRGKRKGHFWWYKKKLRPKCHLRELRRIRGFLDSPIKGGENTNHTRHFGAGGMTAALISIFKYC